MKSAAQAFLSETEVWSYFGDTFRLQLAHNSGVFLSLGSALPEVWRSGLFTFGVSFFLLALLSFILFSRSLSCLELIALALLLAGGIGNLIDRASLGYVVDFMNIGIGAFRTGIFNVADVAVSLGVLILIAGSFKDATTAG
jgi:signal peptidase II